MNRSVPFDFDTMRLADKTYWYLPLVESEDINVHQHIFSKEHIWHEDDEISALHYHDFYEIEILFNGDVHHTDPLGSFDMGPLDYVMYEPHYAHDLKFGRSKDLLMITVQFKKSLFDINTQFMLNSCKFPLYGHLSHENAVYFASTLNVIDDIKEIANSNYSSYMMALKAVEMLVIAITAKTNEFTESDLLQKGYKEIIQAYDYIKDNFHDDIKINEIALSIGYTPNYFSHKFKQVIGMGFNECLNEERMKYAFNRIIFSDEPIKDICNKAGFGDIKNFYKLFKRKYNTTPSKLRARNKK